MTPDPTADAARAIERAVAERTAELEAELRRLEHMLNTDTLTGLASRHALEVALRGAYEQRPPGGYISFIMVDLNGLKRINDAHGHAAGDDALRDLASILRDCAAEPEFLVGRLSGDEFGVLAVGLESPRVFEVAEQVSRRAWERLPFGASVGMACAVMLQGEADNPSQLLRHADSAQYQAKRARTMTPVTASGLVLGAGSGGGRRRSYRDLGHHVEALLAECAQRLDELQSTDPMLRINCVVQCLLEPTTMTTWAVSRLDPGADAFTTIAYQLSSIGRSHHERFESFYTDDPPYPITEYPLSLAAAAGGVVIVRAEDPDADPREKEVLALGNLALMVMVGGHDGAGNQWLIEAFSEDAHFPAELMATPLRAAVAMALTGVPPSRYARPGGRAS